MKKKNEVVLALFFFFQARGGIRVPLWSRGLENVYKRQVFASGDMGGILEYRFWAARLG